MYCMTTTAKQCADCGRDRPIRARGLCGSCYNRARKNKDPRYNTVRKTGPEYMQLSRDTPGKCWPWQGSLSSHGYGMFIHDGKRTYAHRVTYETAHGALPEGMTVDHTCRVRSCVNPDHLEAVSRADNLRRAVKHRRPQKARLGHGACDHGNTDLYVDPSGKRVCRVCRRERTRLWRQDKDYGYRE